MPCLPLVLAFPRVAVVIDAGGLSGRRAAAVARLRPGRLPA
jgi:hypothetical protein